MPIWFLLALVSMVAATVMYLTMRLAQLRGSQPATYLFGFFAFATIMYACVAGLGGDGIRLSRDTALLTLVVCGGAAFLGNAAEQYSIRDAPNPGYALAINRSSAVVATLVAALVLHARLSAITAVAVVVVTVGAIVVVAEVPDRSGAPARTKSGTLGWFTWSLATLASYSTLALVAKVVADRGVPVSSFLFYVTLPNSLLFGITAWRKGGLDATFRRHVPLILAMSITGAVMNLTFFRAVHLAPNVGYPIAVNGAAVALIAPLAAYFFGDHLSWRRITGIVIIVAGVATLSIAAG